MPATSKAQQRLFGMVHAYQKGKLKHAPASVKRIAKHISEEDAKHFAETKHEGLPEKKKEKKMEKDSAYVNGFLSKCAEYGLDERASMYLMEKIAAKEKAVEAVKKLVRAIRNPSIKPLRKSYPDTPEGYIKFRKAFARWFDKYYVPPKKDPFATAFSGRNQPRYNLASIADSFSGNSYWNT